MQEFSGFDYIKIDVANNFGLDKELFEDRIQWVDDNMDNLESLVTAADEPPLYLKAVMALRDAQNHVPTGHVMGFDACASGLQVMAAVIGCETTARNVGLVDPNVRADIYTTTTGVMGNLLGADVPVQRKLVKKAQMTHFYGSKKQPKDLFGEDSPELAAFYKANWTVAPGACELMEDLMGAWQPFALVHQWNLPDGFHARVKVIEETDVKVEVDELNHATFTHRFKENKGTKKGLSIAANIVHSIDGMVVREMNRRCNHSKGRLAYCLDLIEKALTAFDAMDQEITCTNKFISLVEVEHLNKNNVWDCEPNDLLRLRALIKEVLDRPSFEIITVHDEFKCSPNHMNHVRYWYKEILAELAESTVMEDILNQIHGTTGGKLDKYSKNLAKKIRGSNYALS